MESTEIFIIYTFLSLNSSCKINLTKLQCGPKVWGGGNLEINTTSSLVKLSAYLRNTDEHGLNYINLTASDRVVVGWRYVQTNIVRLWWSDQQYVPAQDQFLDLLVASYRRHRHASCARIWIPAMVGTAAQLSATINHCWLLTILTIKN